MTVRKMSRACVHVTDSNNPFLDLINRGQDLDMTVQINVPRFWIQNFGTFL